MPKMLRLTESQLHALPHARVRGEAGAVLVPERAASVPGGACGAAEAGGAGGGNAAPVEGRTAVMPWPLVGLSPNNHIHWAKRSRLARLYRNFCCLVAKQARLRVDWEGPIHFYVEFVPPDRRRRDDDNLIASFKAGRDGIADALGVDDSRFRLHPWVSKEPIKHGAVRIRLAPNEGGR